MKAHHFPLALVVCGLLACHNSTDPSSDPPSSETLATVPVTYYGAGSAEILTTIRFSLSMRASGPDTGLAPHYALFDQLPIRDGDEGTTLVANANNDPDFMALAAHLTDGIDEAITACESGGCNVTNESTFFVGRSSTGPDFAGYTIDSIEFQIDSVLIASPGRNPNRNGIWTDYDLGGRVVVLGRRNRVTVSGRVE